MSPDVKGVHDERAARRYLLGLHMAIQATILHIGVCAGGPHRIAAAVRCSIERLATALLVTAMITATMMAPAVA
jgi:hypothetical protein